MMAYQLVDSEVVTTRYWWRRHFWKFTEAVANDPRPMREIVGGWPDWRKGSTA